MRARAPRRVKVGAAQRPWRQEFCILIVKLSKIHPRAFLPINNQKVGLTSRIRMWRRETSLRTWATNAKQKTEARLIPLRRRHAEPYAAASAVVFLLHVVASVMQEGEVDVFVKSHWEIQTRWSVRIFSAAQFSDLVRCLQLFFYFTPVYKQLNYRHISDWQSTATFVLWGKRQQAAAAAANKLA